MDFFETQCMYVAPKLVICISYNLQYETGIAGSHACILNSLNKIHLSGVYIAVAQWGKNSVKIP